MKLLRKHAPQIKWVVTFADGTQCGDGTIYRAAGFVLTGIKVNDQIWAVDGSATVSRTSFEQRKAKKAQANRNAKSLVALPRLVSTSCIPLHFVLVSGR